MAGLFDRAGINRGVTTGSQGELFGDQTIQVISAAIIDVNGTPTLADNISAREITDLLNIGIESGTDNYDGTYTFLLTDGTSFTIDATASDLTGDEIISLINGATGTISADRTEATVTVANSANPVDNLRTVSIDGIVYRVSGSTPAHAQLRTSITFSPTSVQEPLFGTTVVRGTVSASIENAGATDAVTSVTINSVHSSYADDRLGTPVVVDAMSSRFPWSVQAGDLPQTVVFTVAYTVTYTIDGVNDLHHFTETANFNIIAEPEHYWTGAITQANLNALTISLADNQINNIAGLTRRDNFSSPATITYNGGVPGSTPSLYAVIVVQQDIAISTLNSDGFPTSISSFNDSTTGRTIYTTEAFLSEGSHILTWRTA